MVLNGEIIHPFFSAPPMYLINFSLDIRIEESLISKQSIPPFKPIATARSTIEAQ
jgi:hypothetical protein